MAGDLTRKAIAVQPEWLSQVPTDRRLPEGRIAVVGCGTSFHAAQTSGNGYDALEFVLHPREADVLVLVSHEGTTPSDDRGRRGVRRPEMARDRKGRESPGGAV